LTTILVIGTGPLFAPDVKVFSGQSFRTWHFTQPLLETGHTVDLVVLPTEGLSDTNNTADVIQEHQKAGTTYRMVHSTDPDTILKSLSAVIAQKAYDCIVAVNINAGYYACRLETTLPLWIDLNGYMMGEAQAKCKVYESDSYLMHFWERERVALRRADRFSAVSYKQMLAVIGELGAVGRLNRYTFSHQFVSVVPNAAYEEFLDPASYPYERSYRGKEFPEDAFAVLWSGGFNTWTDTKTLAAALSLAMEQNPHICFVATGAAIPGHDELTYESFTAEMSKTGFLDKCHMLGWVEAKELFSLHRECDIGINVDSLNYETIFGARNRLTNMMAAGLPVLTTLGTELSELIREQRLGYVVGLEDVAEFSNALLHGASNPNNLRQFSQRAKRYVIENFGYAATTKGLLKWVEEPTRAPDNDEKVRRNPTAHKLAAIPLNPIEEELLSLERLDIPDLLRQKGELESIRSKFLYRLYKKLF
jgi:glycosyltransferase involved in cell wall biosynthesis